jgi:hypothetical protein
MSNGSDPKIVTITVRAIRSPQEQSGRKRRKHCLSITDGPSQLQDLLHEHATFQKAIREAQEVLGVHGIDCIRVINDPNYEEQSRIYGVFGRESELLW